MSMLIINPARNLPNKYVATLHMDNYIISVCVPSADLHSRVAPQRSMRVPSTSVFSSFSTEGP